MSTYLSPGLPSFLNRFREGTPVVSVLVMGREVAGEERGRASCVLGSEKQVTHLCQIMT